MEVSLENLYVDIGAGLVKKYMQFIHVIYSISERCKCNLRKLLSTRQLRSVHFQLYLWWKSVFGKDMQKRAIAFGVLTRAPQTQSLLTQGAGFKLVPRALSSNMG